MIKCCFVFECLIYFETFESILVFWVCCLGSRPSLLLSPAGGGGQDAVMFNQVCFLLGEGSRQECLNTYELCKKPEE